MNGMPTHEIVPPEPHSRGPGLQEMWAHLPRWLQVVLVLTIVVVGVLITFFVK